MVTVLVPLMLGKVSGSKGPDCNPGYEEVVRCCSSKTSTLVLKAWAFQWLYKKTYVLQKN